MAVGHCQLWVMDKTDKTIHRIGEWQHDSLWVDMNGEIHYHNLQNGDGGTAKDIDGYGYVILESEFGYLEGKYGIQDKRFEDEIQAYLDKMRKDG